MGLVPVKRYMREPIIDWYVVTCSFGCCVIPFVSSMPLGKGIDTVFEFSIPNRERIVPIYRSLVRTIPSDLYGIWTPSRNEASPRSYISNAIVRGLMRVIRWEVSAEYIAMSSM